MKKIILIGLVALVPAALVFLAWPAHRGETSILCDEITTEYMDGCDQKSVYWGGYHYGLKNEYLGYINDDGTPNTTGLCTGVSCGPYIEFSYTTAMAAAMATYAIVAITGVFIVKKRQSPKV